MIFLLGEGEQNHLFLLLTEQDVNNMRGGRTCFVRPEQLQGKSVQGIVCSLHKNQEAARDVLRASGINPAHLQGPQARVPVEGVCEGCQGLMAKESLFQGMCCPCWAERARHYEERVKQLEGK